MPTFVSGTSTDFTPAPAGTHQAVCVDVVDHGMQETQWGLKRKVSVRWQIDETMDNGKRFLVSKKYTASLNEKAVLRHDLEAWRGKAFTFDELAQFDLDNLIGANCLLNIVHNVDAKNRTWANVASIARTLKSMTMMAGKDYIRERDRTKESEASDPAEDERHFDADEDRVPF